MVSYLIAFVTLVSILFVAHHVLRVPAGPACPRCGRQTRAAQTEAEPRRLVAAFATENATCSACGWSGRMRRSQRLETAPVRLRHGGRS